MFQVRLRQPAHYVFAQKEAGGSGPAGSAAGLLAAKDSAAGACQVLELAGEGLSRESRSPALLLTAWEQGVWPSRSCKLVHSFEALLHLISYVEQTTRLQGDKAF